MITVNVIPNSTQVNVTANTVRVKVTITSDQLAVQRAITARNEAEGFAQSASDDADQTALDRIATGEDRTQTGLDVTATEGFRNEAEGFAGDAEDARDEILDKAEVNLTTAGNILRADGTEYKAVNETDFLQSKVPFERSVLGASIDLRNAIVWDGFNRDNGAIGTADSGQVWEAWNNSINIENKFAIGTAGSVWVIERTYFGVSTNANLNRSRGSVFVRGGFAPRGGISGTGIIIGKDPLNYLLFEFQANSMLVKSIIDGVTTIITGQVFSNFSSQMQYVSQINVMLHHDSAGNLACFFWMDNRNDIIIRQDLSSIFATLFPLSTDVKYLGIALANNTSQCSNFIAYNLSN